MTLSNYFAHEKMGHTVRQNVNIKRNTETTKPLTVIGFPSCWVSKPHKSVYLFWCCTLATNASFWAVNDSEYWLYLLFVFHYHYTVHRIPQDVPANDNQNKVYWTWISEWTRIAHKVLLAKTVPVNPGRFVCCLFVFLQTWL